MDDVYHSLARHYGLSDCAFWILYTIRENKDGYTQSQLCEMLSCLKRGQKEGCQLCVNTTGAQIKTLAPHIANYAKYWLGINKT